MEKPISPHDRFFRISMTNLNVAQDFFNHYLPAKIKNNITLNSLRLCKESYIDEQLKLNVTDILYAVNIQQQSGYLYLLVEHQSTPDVLMPFRIMKYIWAIMDAHLKKTRDKKLPLVVPLVFYNGKNSYSSSTDILDLFGESKHLAKDFLLKPFKLVDIGQIPDDEIRKHKWSGIMEFVAKHIWTRDFLPWLHEIMPQVNALVEMDGWDYIVTTFNYIYNAGNIPNEQAFVEFVQNELSKEIGDKIMTLAEIHLERGKKVGLQVGLQKGRQEGKQEAMQYLVQRLLERGYNTIAVSEITGLSIAEIHQLQVNEKTTV